MHIFVLPKFARQFKRLPFDVQETVIEKEALFRKNPFDSRLKTHKLIGKLEGFWSFSVTYEYRIIFEFIDSENVRFYKIGDHKIYD